MSLEEEVLPEYAQENKEEQIPSQEDAVRERLIILEKKCEEIERLKKFLVFKNSEMNLKKNIRIIKKLPDFAEVDIEDFLGDSSVPTDEYIQDFIDRKREIEEGDLSRNSIVLENLIRDKYKLLSSFDEGSILKASKELNHLQEETQKEIFNTELEVSEKRQEIINEEKEKIKEMLPRVEAELPDRIIFKQKGTGFIEPAIEKKEDKFSFDGWDTLKLYPVEFTSLREKYGDSLSKEVLLAAYSDNINQAFKSKGFGNVPEIEFVALLEKAIDAKILEDEIKIEVEKIFGEIPGLDAAAWEQRIEKLEKRKVRAQESLLKLDLFEKSLGDKTYRLEEGKLIDSKIKVEMIIPTLPEKPVQKQKKGLFRSVIEDLFGEQEEENKKENTTPAISDVKNIEEVFPIDDALSFLSEEFRPDWKDVIGGITGTASEVLQPIREYLNEKASITVSSRLLSNFDKYNALAKELE